MAMMMRDISITLASNDSLSTFPDNTLSSFENMLANPIVRRAHKWYIALDAISFHNVFSNMPDWISHNPPSEPHFIAFTMNHVGGVSIKHGATLLPRLGGKIIARNIPDRFYDGQQFLSMLNNLFDKHLQGKLDWYMETDGMVVRVDGTVDVGLLVHPRIAQWLSMTPDKESWVAVGAVRYIFFPLSLRPGQTRFARSHSTHRTSSAPEYVRISMSGLRHTGGSDRCKTTLAVVMYNSDRGRDAFFHEVKVREFVELEGDRLENLQVLLQDAAGKQLRLASGQPTFVKLTLREMDSQSFMMRFSSRDVGASGINSNFVATLSVPLQLEAKEWQIALSSIQFPSTFKRMQDVELRQELIFIRLGERTVSISLQPAHLSSAIALVTAINTQASTLGGLQFALHSGLLRVQFSRSEGVVQITNRLAILLGVADLESANVTRIEGTLGTTYLAPNPVNVNRFTPATMMLYCDAIDPVIVGSRQLQVLKMVPVHLNGNVGSRWLSYECKHLDFTNLAESHTPSIHFTLARFDGKVVEFDNDQEEILYNLYFRKKSDQ
jgi:hypothetical protein